jgi:hypothetical protein
VLQWRGTRETSENEGEGDDDDDDVLTHLCSATVARPPALLSLHLSTQVEAGGAPSSGTAVVGVLLLRGSDALCSNGGGTEEMRRRR